MFIVYDYLIVKIMDECDINGILIGDLLGMVIKGEENILFVIIDEIIYYIKVVKNGVKNVLIVSDMFFLFYYVFIEDVVKNVGRFIKEGGVYVVKLEGGLNVIK